MFHYMMKINSTGFAIVAIICGLAFFSQKAEAQFYFGKNKVQYTKFDWQVMETDHFKIYFYSEEEELAEIAARSAEEAYRVLAAKFNHEVYAPIPLIIYSNPNHFVQTNVTWSMLPENVAGFTEFIKGRVVVPFNGSYSDFDQVIRHELVHVFTIAKISRSSRERGSLSTVYPPLWFTEGLAECWSREPDSETDLIIRDMVISGRLPSIKGFDAFFGSYYMYKLGESVCNFIEDHYGADKLTRIFDNWTIGRNFEEVVSYTLGDNLNELSQRWSYSLKKKYFPQITVLDLPDKAAVRLTKKEFAVRPVPVMVEDEDGEMRQWVIYKANRSGYSAIYMRPASGNGKKTVTLLKGERSAKFESLHLLSSGIDQHDNRQLLFSSKSKETDVLYLYDLLKRKTIRRYEFDDLVAISSPRFSHDGLRVIFSGFRFCGYSDLYLLDLESGEVTGLTRDIYNDTDPCFSADDQAILFSSDRGGDGFEGFTSIYRIDLNGNDLTRLTFGKYHDRGPDASPAGDQIIFSSDRGKEGAINIFCLEGDQLKQVTQYITGAFDPRFGESADEIYFHAYQNLGFHLFKAKLADQSEVVAETPTTNGGTWAPGKISAEAKSTTIKYETDYSLDIAQSTIAYDGVYGTVGGIQAAVSDVLGNNTFILLLTNTARTKDEFLSSFNGAVTYLRRSSRLNWGVGAFHLYDEYYNDFDGYYLERIVGGAFYTSYPISKFDRIESSVFLRYSDKVQSFSGRQRLALMGTHLLSYVTDNSLWEPTGPIEGRRMNLTVGYTYDLRSNQSFNRLASADLRHYLRLGHLSAFASRFFAFTSSGLEPQRIYMGGSWSFRGYGWRHFYNRNILFNSEELRFPLLNDLILAFPIGNMRLRGFRGALFHDLGAIWDDRWTGWKGSFGASIRVSLGYFVVLRLDFSRTHDFKAISDNTRTDFFFGWNF